LSCIPSQYGCKWPGEYKYYIVDFPFSSRNYRLSLLAIHYYEEVNQKASHVAAIGLWAVMNFLFLVITISLSVLTKHHSTSTKTKHTVEYIYVAFATFLALLISFLLGYYGNKLYHSLLTSQGSKRALLRHLQSPSSFFFMNWTLVVLFAFRGVLSFVVGAGFTHLPSDGRMTYHGGHGRTPLFPFTYYILVEILPCTIVAVTLWQPFREPGERVNAGYERVKNNSEVDAKFDDLFAGEGSRGRGHTVSRDGDAEVKVVYSAEILGALQRQRQAEQEEYNRAQMMRVSDLSGTSSLTSASRSPQMPPRYLHNLSASPDTNGYGFYDSPAQSLNSPLLPHMVPSPPPTSLQAPQRLFAPDSSPHTQDTQEAGLPGSSFPPSTGVALMTHANQHATPFLPNPSEPNWLEAQSTSPGTAAYLPPPAPPRRPNSTGPTPLGRSIGSSSTSDMGAGGGGYVPPVPTGAKARLYASELSPQYILHG
jgi:hypothetical protein